MGEQLTPQQKRAVYDRGGSLLVSAAAGSGKTKVLVDRLLSYIMDPVDPADLDDFLIITYTKAAASELRGKIAAKITERIADNPTNRHLQQQMQRLYLTKISTVHSFCSDILREYAYMLDISADFRMAEETECQQLQAQVLEQILDEAYESISEHPDLQAFVDTQGLGRDDRQVPEIILKVYNSARCHLDPKQWLKWCVSVTDVEHLSDAGQTPWGKYLIDDLHQCIDLHLSAFGRCQEKMAFSEGMEKVSTTVAEDIQILRQLRLCTTWDQLHNMVNIGWSRFPGKYTNKELADKIKAIRGACKDDIKKKLLAFSDPSQRVLQDLDSCGVAARGLVYLVERFWESYDRIKKNRRVLDFADLEHRMLDLLYGKSRSGLTTAAKELSKRFREIMVDEYQDSNAVQDAIFSALTQERNNCFMVGDVKQSIYQFRLADPGIFLEKYDSYTDAENAIKGEPRKVLLSNNFRSAGQVIHAVNDVFSFCMSHKVGGLVYGQEEMLHEGIPHAKNTEPEIELYTIQVQEDTYREEAAFVAQRIRHLLDGTHTVRSGDGFRPITPEDIVILLRSPGSVGAEFCCALQDLGIRCAMGGSEDLLQTEEIGSLCALLQTISNPLQDIALTAALSSRVFCFTADELAHIRGECKYSSFYQALTRSSIEKAKQFLELLRDLRRQARMCSITQLIEYIFAKTGMDSIFASMGDGAIRTANLQAFCQFAASLEATGKKDLEQFLEQLEVLSEKGMVVGSDQKPSDAVTIMSIHKSKGLEFPVVFLCGLSRRFNHRNAQEQVLCDGKLGLGLACVDTKQRVRYPSAAKKAISLKIISEGISEEMRVLYVALTRARDRLIMTYASAHLENALTDISQRIDLSDRLLMTSDVDCPGKWILQTAVCRTEAGQLHALGGHPESSCVSEDPWLIEVIDVQPSEIAAPREASLAVKDMPSHAVEKMQQYLGFQYAHPLATTAPSKQTATQLKGRDKDQEAAELTLPTKAFRRKFRKPSFVASQTSGTTYGNAVHTVMQRINFRLCGSEAAVREELLRLSAQGYIDQDMADRIPCGQITAFFKSDLGQKFQNSNVIREFKFSVLDDGSKYVSGLQGEQILLQGVIDCALIEDDGITVIDFKTDRVTEETLWDLVAKYTPQISAYGDALERIYQKKLKAAYLYFFHLDKAVNIH